MLTLQKLKTNSFFSFVNATKYLEFDICRSYYFSISGLRRNVVKEKENDLLGYKNQVITVIKEYYQNNEEFKQK